MSLIKPFRALRPAPGRAADVLAPPYDVLSSAEARERAKGKPWSFLHVSKPEIDLDPAIDPYDRAVYAKAAENLQRMIEAGVLDPRRQALLLRLPADLARTASQTGLAAVASLADYADQPHPQARADHAGEGGRPRPPDRGGQRADRPGDDRPIRPRRRSTPCWRAPPPATPDVDVTADDGVRHQLWVIDDEATIAALDARVRRAAGALHRRRPSSLGRGGAGRRGARRRDRLARLFPRR